MTYIYLGDLDNWDIKNVDVLSRINSVLGEDWKKYYEPSLAGMDGIWFILID